MNILRTLGLLPRYWRAFFRPKIFCIGRNKTGTTSLAAFLNSAEVFVGNQGYAERLMGDWHKRDFRRLIRFVRYRGTAFQDVPFSLPGTYAAMDKAFPRAKFVLTQRDSAEVWYKSLVNFHSQVFGHGAIPTRQDLEAATYNYPGWAYESFRYIYNTPEDDLYHKETLINAYEAYNQEVLKYFENRPGKLIVVNLKERGTAAALAEFLDLPLRVTGMPWENRSR